MFPTGKTKWFCRQCFKHLSSKRSYNEHMNIHNETRPFACDQCDYSAASQMTLRRHKLRNHIPRQAWGYQCPYCGEAYMEPASYQQHVLTRHTGCSATFGCLHIGCTFTTKSSKHFRNHLKKHFFIMSVKTSSKCFSLQPKYDITRYLVDDELGSGYGKLPLLPVARRVSTLILPAISNLSSRTSRAVNLMLMDKDYMKTSIDLETASSRATASSSRKDFDSSSVEGLTYSNFSSFKTCDDLPRSSLKTNIRKDHCEENNNNPRMFCTKNFQEQVEPTFSFLTNNGADWIEAEVVIDDQIVRLPDGQIDDIELD